jgi:hypothetical protein
MLSAAGGERDDEHAHAQHGRVDGEYFFYGERRWAAKTRRVRPFIRVYAPPRACACVAL